jgi:serine/threonine-protein kinase
MRDDVVPSVGTIIAGKYRVESVVGIGGMGVVVSARHLTLGQVVAIKLLAVLGEEGRAEAHSRFLREAQAAAALRSDHVVKIHDVGALDSGLPFMVMELLEGSDLGALIDADGPMRPDEAVDYLLQACAAIAEAHSAGIIHRDLKPSNLFRARRSDGTPLIKVLDFGISKSIASSDTARRELTLTSTRSVMGSPYYMSPEQVRDARKVDARSDIWSLGVILHELLTAEPVFSADTFPGVCAAIVADPPRAIRSVRPELSEDLERVVLTCLEKEPSRRYQSVEELARALLPFASDTDSSTGSKLWRPLLTAHPSPARSNVGTDSEPSGIASRFGLDRTVASPRVPRTPRIPSGDTKTQLSADLIPTEAPPAAPAPNQKSRVAAVVAVTVLGAAIIGFLALRGAETTSAASTPTSSAAPPAISGTLTVDSNPPGADVYEGDDRLGQTPLTLTSFAPGHARRFVIRKAGYQDYVFERATLSGDVRVHAVLAPVERAPAPSAAENPVPEVSAAPKRAPRSPGARPKPSVEPPPASDIRLQR